MTGRASRAWRRRAAAGAALAALALAGCGGGGGDGSAATTGSTAATAPPATAPPATAPSAPAPAASSASTGRGAGALVLQQAFVDVVNRVSPSVVQIATDEGLGSGIVFDDKGDVVTNAHVVGNARTFEVTTRSGTRLKGTLVGRFAPDDLAVIKVDGGNLPPAAFADSSKVRVGDLALAIGNPLGLQSSVTDGIVSAIGRDVSEGNGVTLPRAIQTSAAINPGNSGGALVDIEGRVIGIPTLAATDPQLGGGAAPGIGFAIPSDTVSDIASQIITSGRVTNSRRAYLGVNIADTVGANGVYVNSVTPGGSAACAGIAAGDFIVSIDGHATPTTEELGQVLADLKPGQTVPVKVASQSGATRTVQVTVGEYPGR